METGTLRTVPFKEVYESIVSRLGLDPSQPVPHNLWQAIPRNINKRLRTAWTYWEWPYLELCDERAFARTWLSDHQFAAGELVIYVADLKYYRAKGEPGDTPPVLGVPPTNATYWDPVTDYGNLIAFDQICRRPMGMVLGVYKGDPRSNGCGCQGLGYRPQQNGVAVHGTGGPTVYVKYQLPVPRFSLTPYAPGRAYKTGNLVYDSISGECYIAVAPSQNEVPPNGLFWLRQEFPAVFEDYVVAAAYASCLKEQTQAPEAGDQQQMRMMWARDAESEAEDALVQEIDKLKAMGQRFHYRSWKESCHHMHAPGVCSSEPWTPPEAGLAPPVTTLKEICESDPTAYVPPTEGGGDGGGDGEGLEIINGVTQLVADQAYIDVTFLVPQENANWLFVECHVENTTDETPLNIWPGILTNKTATGFRLQLSGAPDSTNYYLHWGVTGGAAGPPPTVATTYSLTGPSSGNIGVASSAFTVQLPSGSTVPAPVTVTPSDGGAGGTFTPTSRTLTTAAPSASFTYTPASYGAKTISVTNDGGLTDPASKSYTSTAAAYTLTGPSGGVPGVASTNFTVALPAGGVVSGTAVITPSDGAGGGTFAPTTVNLTTAAPSATFTYNPASVGAKTISVTNNKGMTNPGNLTYTAATAEHLLNTLISYWKLDEASGNRADTHGTNNLTDVNTVGSAAGKIGNAAVFVSASSQQLSHADNASLQVTSDYTFSLWVKLTSNPSAKYLLAKAGAPGGADYFMVIDATQGFEWTNGNGAVAADFAAVGSPPTNGVWYHIVFWYDATGDGKVHMRINDTTTYVSTNTVTPNQTAAPFFIGGGIGGGNTLFSDSTIDEVGFWKRKLTAGEITALYNGGAGLPYSSFTA